MKTKPRRPLFGLLLLACAAAAIAQEVPPSVKAALTKADNGIAAILKVPPKKRSLANTVVALDRILAQLDVDTSLTLFMQFVSTDSEERENARTADEAVTNWTIALGKREDLFKVLRAYANTKPKLGSEEQRLLDHWLRDFRRSGMALSAAKRKQLQTLEEQINKLSIEFEKNIAEDESKVPCTKEELRGVPEDVINRLPQSRGMYLVGMDGPTYGAVMDYCEDPLTRHRCWLTHKRRAGQKNVQILERLIGIRAQAASLLGYRNRVDYEIETRMAKNSETVAKFYQDLEPVVRKKAEVDKALLDRAKAQFTGDPDAKLDVWDYAFFKNRLLKDKFAVDSQKVAEYFPMERVVHGLFSITSLLYNIEYRDVTANAKTLKLPLWHEDVKLYEVYDRANGRLLGRLYTDLYPRPAKYTHAACWGLRPRFYIDGKEQVPLAALVCNFTKPTAVKPSLLPHDEVETFFHEFGHGLHHLLAQCHYGRFSGTAVARDFVEAPSQMMENWVWNAQVLDTFAQHYQSGAKLPKELLDGMIAARTLGSGIETSFQLFLGEMDQAFHSVPDGKVQTTKAYQDVWARLMPYAPIPETYYQASFGHLTGYQGAYYGYLWSLVYAQDLFQKFEELGLLNPEAGKYYREKILGRGGSMDEMPMIKDYLGREPKTDAFLKHLGLSGG